VALLAGRPVSAWGGDWLWTVLRRALGMEWAGVAGSGAARRYRTFPGQLAGSAGMKVIGQPVSAALSIS